MDPSNLLPLILGPSGTVVLSYLWIKNLLKKEDICNERNNTVSDDAIKALTTSNINSSLVITSLEKIHERETITERQIEALTGEVSRLASSLSELASKRTDSNSGDNC